MGCGDRAGDPHLPRPYGLGHFRGVFAGREVDPDGEWRWDGADLAVVTASTAGADPSRTAKDVEMIQIILVE